MEHQDSRHELSEQLSKHHPVLEKVRESATDSVYVAAFKNRVRLRIGDHAARTADMSSAEARQVALSLLEAAERAAACRVR